MFIYVIYLYLPEIVTANNRIRRPVPIKKKVSGIQTSVGPRLYCTEEQGVTMLPKAPIAGGSGSFSPL